MFTAEMARANAVESNNRVNRIIATVEKHVEEWSEKGTDTVSVIFANVEVSEPEYHKIYNEFAIKRGFYCTVLLKDSATMITLGWGDKSIFRAVVNHRLYGEEG